MKTTNQLNFEHDLLLEELNERIKTNIRRLGGFTKATKKSCNSAGMLSYYLRSDNFKTKIRTLNKLEGLQ